MDRDREYDRIEVEACDRTGHTADEPGHGELDRVKVRNITGEQAWAIIYAPADLAELCEKVRAFEDAHGLHRGPFPEDDPPGEGYLP
jgi:hypothetical protein